MLSEKVFLFNIAIEWEWWILVNLDVSKYYSAFWGVNHCSCRVHLIYFVVSNFRTRNLAIKIHFKKYWIRETLIQQNLGPSLNVPHTQFSANINAMLIKEKKSFKIELCRTNLKGFIRVKCMRENLHKKSLQHLPMQVI